MSTRPPMTLLSPQDGQLGSTVFAADALTRVVLAGDEEVPTTAEGWNELGSKEAWPRLMESATRLGLQPAGTWAMILDPGSDWRRHIHPSVQEQVDAGMREDPAVRVLCVAILVDTASIRDPMKGVTH